MEEQTNEPIKVISLDIETTGLDPAKDQILEIGARAWTWGDLTTPVSEMPSFSTVVKHHRLSGQAGALLLNTRLLQYIEENYEACQWPSDAIRDFTKFIAEQRGDGKKPVALGKNAGSFDLPFLYNAGLKPGTFKSRILDPAALWLMQEDVDGPPGLGLCASRAGMSDVVTHCALDDADQTLDVFRAGLKRLWRV